MEDEFTFRKAEVSDFEAVLDLASQLANHIEEESPRLTVAQFERYYLSPEAPMHLLLALLHGRVVGMIAWTLTHELYSADVRVYISDVSVDRSARGRGVGAALIDRVKAWGRLHNASKLGWEVWHRNFGAQAFYERLGASTDREAISYVMRIQDQS